MRVRKDTVVSEPVQRRNSFTPDFNSIDFNTVLLDTI